MLFSHCICILQCSMFFHITLLHPPTHPHPFCKRQRNFQSNTIFQPSNIFQDSTSSNAHHITLLHPPHPPFCKQQRNLQCSNIFQPYMQYLPRFNIIQRTSHNVITPPPPPPSVYKNDLSSITSRLKVPRSSGKPPALSLYIYQ